MKMVLFLAAMLLIFVMPVSFSENITINTNKEQFAGGDAVEISGSVENGNTGDFVALEIQDPDGETILIRTVTLDDNGSFFLKFKIPESGKTGNYKIVANSQQGGQTITETKTVTQISGQESSNEKTTTGGGCLIATATFGSELAPQVQQLRELRENNLLQTESGKSFMRGFNQFYYSFSPTMADWERESPIFKELVKITITPLISTLSILNYVDMDSEVSVLGFGASLILLNVGMYFVAPAIVIHTIRKKF